MIESGGAEALTARQCTRVVPGADETSARALERARFKRVAMRATSTDRDSRILHVASCLL